MPEFDNVAIAGLLDRMGDLLEVSDADRFRYLSYHKAASTIRAWPEQLSVMAEEGRLAEIPGVGKKLAASIEQVFLTGTFPEFEALAETFPPALADMMQIPGVGAKKARLVHDTLGVASVDELEKALAEGRLGEVPGFKDKTVANIAAGLEAYRHHHERLLLAEALPLAERLVEELCALPIVREAQFAGSLRRMQETVGDIDIIASSDDAAAVMEAVRSLPAVARVLASGGTKTSVVTSAGLQVDVRVVEPAQYGAALQYFTGSKEHNVQLRELAKKRGLKVSEYGVFSVADDGSEGERLGGVSEDEVYRLLGMQTPPPEIRQGLGEIEVALDGRLPRLVELTDIRGDLHAHTDSTDSRSSLEENRAKAAELGYEWIAVTDHAQDLRMVRGLTLERLEAQWERIDALNATPGPRILKGIELNIGPGGRIDYAEDVLARFDLCIASLHSGWGESAAEMTSRLLAAMDCPFVDIIGHPTGRILGRRDPIPLDMEAVLAKAGEAGVAMEVNAYPDRLDLSDAHVRAARRYGVRFSLGCDAHHSEQMGYMRFGVAQLRRGWAAPADVLNCSKAGDLLARLRRASG